MGRWIYGDLIVLSSLFWNQDGGLFADAWFKGIELPELQHLYWIQFKDAC